MTNLPLLSFLVFLPLVGAFAILGIQSSDSATADENTRRTALWTTSATFLLSLVVLTNFNPETSGYQLTEEIIWLPNYDIGYRLGIDGISLVFVLLTTFLMPLCILASWRSISVRVRDYMVAFLVLECLMLGMFCASDFVLFYIFFEAVLIPMFLIIGVWGGPRRVYAAFKFFLYTLAGSLLMLLALFAIAGEAGTTDIALLHDYTFPASMQTWLWLAMFCAFAVKVPMWPVHTWLPAAHVEAPTAGSVILAGVLLKMGGYGFIRFSIPMLPLASETFSPLIFTLSIVAIVVTSLIALAQEDMKKLIAYSSVAHMGYVTVGLFTLNHQGVDGAMFQMLSHGLVSAALFLCVGVVYDRLHTREIARYGGLVNRMPRYALVFMLMMLASVGLPGTSGFVGEFLVIMGSFAYNSWLGIGVASGLILGCIYMLVLYRRIIFGKLEKDDLKAMTDINAREVAIFIPLIALVIWMGVAPHHISALYETAIVDLIADYQQATSTMPDMHNLTHMMDQ